MTGIIIAKDIKSRTMHIQKLQLDACSTCKSACSSKPTKDDAIIIMPLNDDFELNEHVEIEVKAFQRILATALIFIFPLFGLLLGYHISRLGGNSEILGIFGAIIGFSFFVGMIVLLYKKHLLVMIYGRVSKVKNMDLNNNCKIGD